MSGTQRSSRLAILVALVFGLPVIGSVLLFLRPRPDVAAERDFDMSPPQTAAFVRTAAQRLGWAHAAVDPLRFEAQGRPVLVRCERSSRSAEGTHLKISGAADAVRSLLAQMDERLPALAPETASPRP